MSYGAGHVFDMINRMKQNRALRPSKRSKFKDHHRDTMLVNPKKPVFKQVSKEALAKIKAQIQHNAQKEKRREKIILILSGLFVISSILVLYFYF